MYDLEEARRLEKQAEALGEEELQALKALGMHGDCTALEVGCGPGFYAQHLMKNWDGLVVHGIDRDEQGDIPDMARNNLSENYRGHDVTLPDPLLSGKMDPVDITYARLLLRHVAHPGEVIGRMKRATRPGGRVILIDADDGALRLYPRVPLFETAVNAAHTFRRKQSPDAIPSIGPQLAVEACAAGLEVTGVRVVVLATTPDTVKQASGIFRPFWLQENIGLSSARCHAIEEALMTWAERPDAFAMWAMYFVGTRVPVDNA